MKGYFKYTTQLISSKGRFHCSALREHPLPYRPSYTGSQSVCTGKLLSVGADYTIIKERQLLERGLIDTIDDEMNTVCYVCDSNAGPTQNSCIMENSLKTYDYMY